MKIDHLEVVQGVVDGGIAVEEVVDEGLAVVILPRGAGGGGSN